MSKNISEYTVVMSCSPREFIKHVQRHINAGWQPYGSPTMTCEEKPDETFDEDFWQAMVKYESDTKPRVYTLQDYEHNKKTREDTFNAEDILGSAAREMRKREGIEQYPEDFDIAWMFAGEVVSTRMGNCLRNMDIYTPEQLALFSEQDLLKMPNLGRKTLKEIRETLKENNLKLKGE
jgi:DNA-directed RNA polymerase alpha subunit